MKHLRQLELIIHNIGVKYIPDNTGLINHTLQRTLKDYVNTNASRVSRHWERRRSSRAQTTTRDWVGTVSFDNRLFLARQSLTISTIGEFVPCLIGISLTSRVRPRRFLQALFQNSTNSFWIPHWKASRIPEFQPIFPGVFFTGIVPNFFHNFFHMFFWYYFPSTSQDSPAAPPMFNPKKSSWDIFLDSPKISTRVSLRIFLRFRNFSWSHSRDSSWMIFR